MRENSTRYEDRTSRQRERIHLRIVDDGETPREVRPLGCFGELHPQSGHVALQCIIGDGRDAGGDFLRRLLAHGDLL